MQYSLLPFRSLKNAGGPDLREQLRLRKANGRGPVAVIDNLELLTAVVELLRDVPWDVRIDHCFESEGELRLAVVATDLGRDVDAGDMVKAGFYLANSESRRFETVACERLHRVVCANGQMVECEEGQATVLSASPEADAPWQERLAQVIARSFNAEGFDRDAARLRATTRQMLMTPFEMLCHLVASNIITEEEHCDIQRDFDAAGDFTLYGLINAVTSVARRLRDDDAWTRAFNLERLGGEILRGDHQPPILAPAFA
jgi:hypothetical protein